MIKKQALIIPALIVLWLIYRTFSSVSINENDSSINEEKESTLTASTSQKTDFPKKLKPEDLPYAFIPEFNYRQGDLVPIKIKQANIDEADEYKLKVQLKSEKKDLDIFSVNSELLAFIPISSESEPIFYKLELFKNNELINSTLFKVNKRNFEIQHLKINKTFETLKTPESRKSDSKKLKNAKATSSNIPLFKDKFIYPLDDYFVSTSFQAIRFVNDTNIIYRHSGIDMAAPKGSIIKAANSGIVSFAGETFSGGNTIIIDHGIGIFTQYMHLDKIYVKSKDKIKQAQEIGEVGTTGFSTGNHLHFDMCTKDTFVDPEQLIKYNILDNLKE